MTSHSGSFPRVPRFVRGYESDEVDDFVARVQETLGKATTASQAITATEARNLVFSRVLGGYAPDAVDQAIDDWATQLPE